MISVNCSTMARMVVVRDGNSTCEAQIRARAHAATLAHIVVKMGGTRGAG